MPMITDQQIIERHSPLVRDRCRKELAIVHCLMETAARAGCTLEEQNEGPTDDLLDLLFNLDDATVDVIKDGKAIGWVRLVFGNDGYDLVADYTTNLEDFLKPVNDLADKLESGELAP